MSTRFPLLKSIALFALLLVVAAAAHADGVVVRGASKYGQDNTPGGGLGICLGQITNPADSFNNCEGYLQGTFTIGGISYKGDIFAFQNDGNGNGILDVLQINPGSSLTLTLSNPSLPTGVFMCGSGGQTLSTPVDSSFPPNPMGGLYCTTGASSTGFLNNDQNVNGVSTFFTSAGVTFTNSTSSPLVVFVPTNNLQGSNFAAVAPEPGTLSLIGLGVLVVRRKLRRSRTRR
jgi:hypothetical protein